MVFSKRLTKTDISKRLAVPTESLRRFPRFPDGGHAIELKVRDNDAVDGIQNISWNFTVSIRTTGKYKKPVFSRGWLDFVRAKGLNVGDRVTVYLTEVPAIRLFGFDVGPRRYNIAVVRGA